MPLGFFDLILQEKEEVTPETGFNVCEYDSWGKLGENLTIAAWFETKEEAETYANEQRQNGSIMYIYGAKLDKKDENYTATGSKMDSEPIMSKEGFAGSRKIPEWSYQPEQLREAIGLPNIENMLDAEESKYREYVYQSHDMDDICAEFAGKIFDMEDVRHRPVPPSEGLGYTNTHPNCICYWKLTGKKEIGEITEKGLKHIQSIHRKIGQRSRHHTLHTVHTDGTLSQRTRGTNPLKETKLIRETIADLSHQFNWINPEYIAKVRDLSRHVGGRFVLVRASAETITDHRSEGEPYRRLLKGDELAQLTRTGIGKTTDINHLGVDYKVDSDVIDAEYDPLRRESQMLVHLRDLEIIKYLMTGEISEVSINAGYPRRMDTDCNTGECFVVPTGMVLGELDGIAFTWVVSNPRGIIWNGRKIPQAQAGVKTTAIELL